MKPDWQKIAQDRLKKIRRLEHRLEYLHEQAAFQIERHLSIGLHAHCVPRNIYQDKLRDIAKTAAEMIFKP